MMILGLAGIMAASLWALQASAENQRVRLPTIGDPADRYLSPAQESKIGEEFYKNLYRHNAILHDPEISGYIRHLGNQISNTLATTDYRFNLFVVKDDTINAFAVPGGYIGVNSGLILSSNTESELASVVSHEIAHVSQRHIARRIADMSNSQLTTLGALMAGILLASSGKHDAGGALMLGGVAAQQQHLLSFSRDMEIEADRIGLDLLYRSGFDPTGMPEFFRTLQRNRYSSMREEYAFLTTHPLDKTRITEAQHRIDDLPTQKHASSDHYYYTKARLTALASNNPTGLLLGMQKERGKRNNISVYEQYAYSQALERKHQFKEAEKILQDLVNDDNENPTFQIALARIKANSDQINDAIEIANRMITLYPNNFAVIYYYSTFMAQSGKPEPARNKLKRYLANFEAPTQEAYKLLAELHEDCGDNIESKKVLAEYYFNTGNPNAAVFQLKDALKDPDIGIIERSQLETLLRTILNASRS